MWGDEKFKSLSPLPPSGQSLWIYFLINPDSTSIPGLFKAGRAAMAESLGWDVKAFDKAFREVFTQGMAKADWTHRLVWIPKAIAYNKPESPNVVKHWKTAWDEIPECSIKDEVYQQLKAFMEGLGKAFAEAFREACPDPLLKPLPNQEQEHLQEQEKDLGSDDPLQATCEWIVEEWNKLPDVTPHGILLPETRKRMTARLAKHPTKAWWNEHFFSRVGASNFLRGKTSVEFVATLGWAMGPVNMNKVLEDRYKNKPQRQDLNY